MKKFRNLIYSIIMVGVLMSTIILSSFSQADKVLLNAEEITKKLLEVGLAEDEELGYISTSYVKGLDGNEDYILAVCETGGYAIYEKETYELIEYSPIGNSPYNQIAENDSYYAGPVNYFKKVDNNYESLTTHEKINVSSGKAIALNLKGKLQTDRESRKQKAEKDVIENGTAIQSTKGNEAISLTNNISTEEINFNKRPADNYNFSDRVYIDNYKYFVNNYCNAVNDYGTCASLSIVMLLGYHDWCVDGRLIPFTNNQTDGTNEIIEERFFDYCETDYLLRAQPYNDRVRTVTTTTIGSQTGEYYISFYDKILSYINPPIINENGLTVYDKGATLHQMLNGTLSYMNDYAPSIAPYITLSALKDESSYAISLTLLQEIVENRPVIAGMYNYRYINGVLKDNSHAVVVYGFQYVRYNSQDILGFICHLGGNNEDISNVWFNATWLNGYLKMNNSHEHSLQAYNPPGINLYEEIGVTNGHLYECSVCGVVITNNNHIIDYTNPKLYVLHLSEHNSVTDSGKHCYLCPCGYWELGYHNFTERYIPTAMTDGDYNNSIGDAKDSQCDKFDHDLEHAKRCACGYVAKEAHWFKSGGIVCMYCGYVDTNPGDNNES